MSFQEVTMYRIACDGCGKSAQDDGDFYAWADKSQAETEAAVKAAEEAAAEAAAESSGEKAPGEGAGEKGE